ncbi:hypothetical protein V8F06_010136 [Rhypophila decipiens]
MQPTPTLLLTLGSTIFMGMISALPTSGLDAKTTSLTTRTTLQFQGFAGSVCDGNLINNGPLNLNECFNLAAPTFSYRPSGNSQCIITAWTSRDCQGDPFNSALATGQCVTGLVINPTNTFAFEVFSVRASC